MLTNAYLLDVEQRNVLATGFGEDEESAVSRALDQARRSLRHLGGAARHYLSRSCRAHLVIAGSAATGTTLQTPTSYVLGTAAWERYVQRMERLDPAT